MGRVGKGGSENFKFMNIDVQFNEEQKPQIFITKKNWGEKLASGLVKYSGGLIKDEQQANYVIIGLVVVMIIISLFLFFGGGGKKSLPKEEIFRVTPSSKSTSP